MPITSETRAMVLLAAQVCEEKKATDTRILELDIVDAGFTDFFLITSGNNTRQTGAIADDIELRLKREFGVYAKSVEGRRTGEWILLDYIDFVVHIFTEETREYYDIERLRKSARPVDTAELAAALREKTASARKKSPAKKSSKGTDLAIIERDATLARQAEAAMPAKKSAAKSATKKTALKKAPAKRAAAVAIEKVPAKKAPAKKAPAKKAPAKKAAAKKSVAEPAPAKKAPAKKAPAKKAPAKKAAAKSVASSSKKAAATGSVEDTSRKALPAGKAVKQLPPPTKRGK